MTPRVVCAPGRHGDILWALPTARAIAEGTGTPVTLVLSPRYCTLAPLLLTQPYLGAVLVDETWDITESAPITPRQPPGVGTDAILLGYQGWPRLPLPFEVYRRVQEEHPDLPLAPLALERPWITAEPWKYVPHQIMVGFSDEWFELKFGLTRLLNHPDAYLIPAPNSRWIAEGGHEADTWEEAARRIAACDLFLGCCSALHVLACALGKRVVLMEPNKDRWQDIFYPYGKTGRVTLVVGNDGLPTFDARHVRDAIQEALACA